MDERESGEKERGDGTEERGPREPRRARTLEGFELELLKSRPRALVTWILFGLNLAVFAAMAANGVSFLDPEVDDLIAWGADFGPMTSGGEWWRLLTSMFVHIGIVHLGVNMHYLLRTCVLTERIFGPRAYLAIYLFSGLCGSLTSLSVHPEVVSAGASGALFGVTGAFLAFFSRRRDVLAPGVARMLGRRTWLFLLYNLAAGWAIPMIDNAAHVGGFLGGLASGMLLCPRGALDAPRARVALAPFLGMGAVLAGGTLLARSVVERSEVMAAYRWEAAWEAEDWNAVLEECTRALEGDPHLARARAVRGAALYRLGEFERARDELLQALAADPGDALSRFYRGLASWELDDLERARTDLELAAKDPELEADARAALGAVAGDVAAGQGFWKTALQEFERVPSDSWLHAYAQERSGWALVNLERHAEALERFQRALEAGCEESRVLRGRVVALRKLLELDGALEENLRLEALLPDDSSVQRELATLRSLRGESALALEAARRAVELDPGSGWGFWIRACVQRELGALAEAEVDLRRAVEKDETRALAWVELGRLRHSEGDHDGAREAYESALRSDPKLGYAEEALGVLEHDLGRWHESTWRIRRALELDDERADALELYAWMNRMRALEDASARDGLARHLERREPKPRADGFPALARFLLGEGASEPSFVSPFEGLDWPSERFEREARLTAAYCVGMQRLVDGDEAGARAAFERCRELELSWAWMHGSARARLAELR